MTSLILQNLKIQAWKFLVKDWALRKYFLNFMGNMVMFYEEALVKSTSKIS